MQFAVIARDATDEEALARRKAARPDHLKNLAKVQETARVACAGGLLDDQGLPSGSLLVMEFDTREQLDAYLASEPYVLNNVWGEVEVVPMNVVILNNEKVGA